MDNGEHGNGLPPNGPLPREDGDPEVPAELLPMMQRLLEHLDRSGHGSGSPTGYPGG